MLPAAVLNAQPGSMYWTCAPRRVENQRRAACVWADRACWCAMSPSGSARKSSLKISSAWASRTPSSSAPTPTNWRSAGQRHSTRFRWMPLFRRRHVPPSSGNTRGMVARKPRRMRQAAGGSPRPRGGNASSRRTHGLFHLHNEPHGKRGYGGCFPVAPRGFLAGSLLLARSRCAGRDADVLSAPYERRGHFVALLRKHGDAPCNWQKAPEKDAPSKDALQALHTFAPRRART